MKFKKKNYVFDVRRGARGTNDRLTLYAKINLAYNYMTKDDELKTILGSLEDQK